MKKRILSLIFAFALLMSTFTGCDEEPKPVPENIGTSGNTEVLGETNASAPFGEDKTQSGNADSAPEVPEEAAELYPAPDYSDFVMPEETGTLIVYSSGMQTKAMAPAVEIFQKLYSEVKVEYHQLDEEEFESQIRTEIPAGKGPDLLFASSSNMPDIYKTISTMVFEDLNPYIINDDEFNPEDYIKGIIDESLYQGRRYFLPVSHFPPILVTTQEILDETGIAFEELSTYDGFIDALAHFHSIYPESNFVADRGPGDLDTSNLGDLYNFCGFFAIDYENKTLSLDESAFRKMTDLCKLYAGNDPNKDQNTNGEYIMYRAILERDCLFSQFGNNSLILQVTLMGLEAGGETPIMFTPPCVDGGKATVIRTFGAIRKNAPNKLNAWRLLKILLSDEIQGNPDTLYAVDPVRKSAVPLFLNHWNSDGWVEENIPGLKEILLDFDHAYLHQPLISQYVRDSMLPYVTGTKTFEDCYKKLLNTLELYKDE